MVNVRHCPTVRDVVVYADPSTSNKNKGNASTKSSIVGYRHKYI
jgi:hypothetical protein